MDGAARLARLRWRHRGAWLWPLFIALTVLDALVAHALPPSGDSQSFDSALIVALVVNLLGVMLLTAPVSALIRRRRGDLPRVIARDYAGRGVITTFTLLLLALGLIHHPSIVAQQNAMHDAEVRAQAWIGDHAPAEFRHNLAYLNTVAIQPGSVYRTCVFGYETGRSYCVVIDTRQPFPLGVRFGGYESNGNMFQGAQ